MSLNARELGLIIGFARTVILDADAHVTVSGANADGTLNFTDLTRTVAAGYTRTTIAALVNRAMKEMPEMSPQAAI